jgi:hypothetical protein
VNDDGNTVERVPRRALITFGYAHEDDVDWSAMAVSSREMLAVERQTKGFSANSFFTNVSTEGLYRVAFVVLKVRGDLPKTVSYDEFIATHDVSFSDPTKTEASASDDDPSEVDPTNPTA